MHVDDPCQPSQRFNVKQALLAQRRDLGQTHLTHVLKLVLIIITNIIIITVVLVIVMSSIFKGRVVHVHMQRGIPALGMATTITASTTASSCDLDTDDVQVCMNVAWHSIWKHVLPVLAHYSRHYLVLISKALP